MIWALLSNVVAWFFAAFVATKLRAAASRGQLFGLMLHALPALRALEVAAWLSFVIAIVLTLTLGPLVNVVHR